MFSRFFKKGEAAASAQTTETAQQQQQQPVRPPPQDLTDLGSKIKTALDLAHWDEARELLAHADAAALKDHECVLTASINGAPADLFRTLVQRGADINEANQFQDTALTLAIWHNQPVDVLRTLIELGANVNQSNSNGNCPITLAAEIKVRPEVVDLLAGAGCNMNQANVYGDTALTLGVFNKAPLELIQALVRHGANVSQGNVNGNHAISLAGEANVDPALAQFLLASGANPNQANKFGDTALSLLSWNNGSPALAQVLIDGGADVNHGNVNGNTVLSLACESNSSVELVACLLRNGADPNKANNWGDTPLSLSAWKNVKIPIVVELLKHGANVNRRSDNGNTPLSLARDAKADPTLIKLLQQAVDGNTDYSQYDLSALHDLFARTRIRKEDKEKYLALFQSENFMDVDSLSTLDRETLKLMGVKLGDANQILRALQGGGPTSPTNNNGEQLASAAAAEEGKPQSLDVLPSLPSNNQYYAFTSHNWGVDDANHLRVKLLVDAFHAQNKPLWFDAARLTGNIESQITKGIDQSAVFLVFVTRTYLDKVNAGAESDVTDWCHYEFAYAGARKPKKMLAVVMDPDMLSVSTWDGPVCARLGSKIYCDFTSNDKLDKCVEQLGKAIAALIK